MTSPPLKIQYQPHIDGIRAIATISVIFFHVEFLSFFSGGYVGVDIFFVISGYLITRLIVKEIQLETFSFSNFYIRRLRRIFPALFFTILISFAVGIILFSPQHLEHLAGSVINSIMSVSNIYFWQESGYFDTSADFKPLLHTWSLSIEEQFYLLWPALLVILFTKLPYRIAFLAIILVGIASLILCFFFQDPTSIEDSLQQENYSTIFYLLPFRIFEFVIGATLILITNYKINGIFSREVFSVIGLLMILYPISFYTKELLYPSYNALLPCIGTAVLIQSGENSIVGKTFNNPLFIKIGLISYSLYLSHWPIYVFYQYITLGDLGKFDKLIIILMSITVSIFMYLFIEQHYRHKGIQDKQEDNLKFALLCAVVSLLLVSISAHVWANNGRVLHLNKNDTINTEGRLKKNEWLNYTPSDQLIISNDAFHDYVWQRHLELEKPFFDHQKINILIVGDSMAGDFVNIIMESKLNSESIEVRTIPMRYGCHALMSVDDYSLVFKKKAAKERCIHHHKAFRDNISLQYADIIILASFWHGWSVNQLANTIRQIKEINNGKVIVIGKKGLKENGLKSYFQKIEINDIHPYTLSINKKISNVKEQFLQINPTDFFCLNNKCPVAAADNYIYLYDKDHLTPKGAKKIGDSIYVQGLLKKWLETP